MDTGRGEFAELEPSIAKSIETAKYEGDKPPSIFRTGEVLEIKNSKFRIHNFDRKFLILELLPK